MLRRALRFALASSKRWRSRPCKHATSTAPKAIPEPWKHRRTTKVVLLEISVAMDHCSGTPTSRLASSSRLVALTSSSSVKCKYKYDLSVEGLK